MHLVAARLRLYQALAFSGLTDPGSWVHFNRAPADVWLRHRPGSDVALLMGMMMKFILDEGLADLEFVNECCENFEAFKESLSKFDPDFVEQATGVPGDKIAEAARLYANNRPSSIVYAMGITQHSHGTDNVLATANLAMLTGNIGKPSTGVNPLRGQNNVQGACDMGSLPNVYTGYQRVDNPDLQKKFENAWICELKSKPILYHIATCFLFGASFILFNMKFAII